MNTKIRITKEFKFEMAHALDLHDGKCKNIHGHSYTLAVKVIGYPKKHNVPINGMVMDFSVLKVIVNDNIIDDIDHALMLEKNSPYIEIVQKNTNQKLKIVEYQPTCENMLINFSNIIRTKLPTEVELHSLYLQETPSSFAEWYAEDN